MGNQTARDFVWFYFSSKVAGGNPRPPSLNDNPVSAHDGNVVILGQRIGTQKILSVQDSPVQCNSFPYKKHWYLDREMIATVWICLGPKIDYHCLLSAVMQVSMFEWRGG